MQANRSGNGFLNSLWAVFLALFAINLFAHYLRMSDFGIYYDDYFAVNILLGMSPGDYLKFAYEWFVSLHNSRPLIGFIKFGHYYLGEFLGSITWSYFLGLVEQAFTAYLIFVIFRRFNKLFAFMAATLFSLFPALVLHAYLSNSFVAQLSFMFAGLTVLMSLFIDPMTRSPL